MKVLPLLLLAGLIAGGIALAARTPAGGGGGNGGGGGGTEPPRFTPATQPSAEPETVALRVAPFSTSRG